MILFTILKPTTFSSRFPYLKIFRYNIITKKRCHSRTLGYTPRKMSRIVMITDTQKTWHITILRWDGAQSVAQIFVVNVEKYIRRDPGRKPPPFSPKFFLTRGGFRPFSGPDPRFWPKIRRFALSNSQNTRFFSRLRRVLAPNPLKNCDFWAKIPDF